MRDNFGSGNAHGNTVGSARFYRTSNQGLGPSGYSRKPVDCDGSGGNTGGTRGREES